MSRRQAPGPKPKKLNLDRAERRKLQVLVRRRTLLGSPIRVRAKAVLALADDPCVTKVATSLGVCRKSVTRWRDRYVTRGLEGLHDKQRPGGRVKIAVTTRCEIIAMACAKPKDFGVPYRPVWTKQSLRDAHAAAHPDRAVSRSSVVRILNEGEIRPHRVRGWLHSPDPNFRERVTEISKLYLAPPPGSVVLCVDEKTGIQALGRKHPMRPAAPGRSARFEYEYIRNGTRKLLAAFNPHTGDVYGEMRANRKAVDLVEFMEEIARRHPTGDVHIVWDNLNIHFDGKDQRWTHFNERHDHRFHFHYTPIHASWVNQIECWFSVLQRRVIRYNAFDTLEALDAEVLGFITHWNSHERKSFRWTFRGYPREIERAVA